MKYCPKCDRELPLAEFHKNRKRSDGLASWCKKCFAALDSQRNRNPERMQARAEGKRACYAPIKAANEAARVAEKAQLRSEPMKACARCNQERPKSSYTEDTRYKDGRYPYCVDCRQVWRRGRKDRQRELERRWAAKNPDRTREMRRQFYDRHKDRIAPKRRAYDRQRYRNDPIFRRRKDAQTALKNRRRRAMLYDIETQHHTESEWQALCEKYNHCCLRCGQQVPLSRDHIVPVVRGGSDTIDNIQPLCRSCNSWKNARTIDFRSAWGKH